MSPRLSPLGILLTLVGCAAPAQGDKGIGTAVGQDSAIENYDEEFSFGWPVKGSLYVDSALIDSTNLVAQYVVEVRRGHPLTLTYMIEPTQPSPLRVLVNMGASSQPILSLVASETELLVYGPQGGQTPVLTETDYSAPIVDAGLPPLDAEAPDGGAGTASVSAETIQDLGDAITALRYDVPEQKFEPIPAMFENLRETSYGTVTGYDPDGTPILATWTGMEGTIEDAFVYMAYCLEADGSGAVQWECPTTPSN